MTYEEAIDILQKDIRCCECIKSECLITDCHGCENHYAEADFREAVGVAIEALEKVKKSEETFEWCTDCKEYDQEEHCCHRFTKTIHYTLEEVKDAYSIVFCEDCIYYEAWVDADGIVTGHHCVRGRTPISTTRPEDYCSYAVRKERVNNE